MSSKIKPDRILDCIGFYCPEPVLRTRIELEKMDSNQVLEVLSDDPAAEEDIKSLIKRIEQQLLEIKKEGNIFRFIIKKV